MLIKKICPNQLLGVMLKQNVISVKLFIDYFDFEDTHVFLIFRFILIAICFTFIFYLWVLKFIDWKLFTAKIQNHTKSVNSRHYYLRLFEVHWIIIYLSCIKLIQYPWFQNFNYILMYNSNYARIAFYNLLIGNLLIGLKCFAVLLYIFYLYTSELV